MACDSGQGVGRRLSTTSFKIWLDVRGRNRQHRGHYWAPVRTATLSPLSPERISSFKSCLSLQRPWRSWISFHSLYFSLWTCSSKNNWQHIQPSNQSLPLKLVLCLTPSCFEGGKHKEGNKTLAMGMAGNVVTNLAEKISSLCDVTTSMDLSISAHMLTPRWTTNFLHFCGVFPHTTRIGLLLVAWDLGCRIPYKWITCTCYIFHILPLLMFTAALLVQKIKNKKSSNTYNSPSSLSSVLCIRCYFRNSRS